MMVGQRRLKKLTVTFTALSILLWAADFMAYSSMTCLLSERIGLTSDHMKGVVQDISNVSSWFSKKVNKHIQSSVLPECPPIQTLSGNRDNYSLSQGDLRNQFDYFGTLIALGNFRLVDPQQKNSPDVHLKVARQLRNISKLIQDSDAAFTTLSGAVNNQQTTRDFLSLIQDLGIHLVSLANHPVSLQVKTGSVQTTVHALEAASIHWLGLNAKRHHIAVVNGQRVGFLAMCAGHGHCVETSNMPFAPVKYSPKVATTSVNELKEHGVDVIIVVMTWGRDSGTYPDETALAITRRIAQLGVNAIVGYSPNAIQDHAYFGSTLVIFSMGNLISFESMTPFCWKKTSDKWTFESGTDHCKIVHPLARQNLQYREQHTRMYKIHLSRSQPAVAEYITLPFELDDDSTSITYGLRRPITIRDNEHYEWTTVCGQSDINCLSCKPF